MATSFIRIFSEDGRPDNPIKKSSVVESRLGQHWAFSVLCLSLCRCGNINEPLSECHGL